MTQDSDSRPEAPPPPPPDDRASAPPAAPRPAPASAPRFERPREGGAGEGGRRPPRRHDEQPERERPRGDRPPFRDDRPRFERPRFDGPPRGDRPPFRGGDDRPRPPFRDDRPRVERPRFDGPPRGDRPPFRGGDDRPRPPFRDDRPRFERPRFDGPPRRPPFRDERPAPPPHPDDLPGFSSLDRFDGDARYEAARLLVRWDDSRVHADLLLDKALRDHPPTDPRDRGFLHELFLGVLRRRDHLDRAIVRLSGRPIAQQPSGLRQLLRLGLYQLFFLDRVPPHAAIHETVGLAIGPLRPALNAILREAQRRGPSVMAPDDDADEATRAAQDAGAPRWLWDYLAGPYGFEGAHRILTQAFAVPPMTLRANTLRTTRDALLERVRAEGFPDARPTPVSPLGIVLGATDDPRPPADWAPLAEGLAAVQDESSQVAALLLGVVPEQRVLDLCAAPGGKATLMAAQMQDRGDLVATDVSDVRRRLVRKLSRQLGASIVRVTDAPEDPALWPAEGPLAGAPFDAILVDAPCSGLGTLSRHPDIRWSRPRGELDQLALLQGRLVRAAWRRLRPGGRLLYATCTLGPVENQALVARFLADTPDAAPAPPTREEFPWLDPAMVTRDGWFETLGEAGVRDGFFAARITKLART